MADCIRSALFVDFDNIYIGLLKADPQAANRFATEPSRWLEWLQVGAANSDDEVQERRILMRLCYLNPKTAGVFRSDFIRAGFRVIDCPSLTRQGKNSADIFMVLDIVDALNHTTSFEEFIVLSGDADFTPVLLRLRDHDRQTVVVSAGHTPTAYSACCGRLISDSEFIEQALGDASSDRTPVMTSRRREAVLKDLANRLSANLKGGDDLDASDLPRLFTPVLEFRTSEDWLGFNGLHALLVKLASIRDDIELQKDARGRIKSVTKKDNAAKRNDERVETSGGPMELRENAGDVIQTVVRKSDAPSPFVTVSNKLRSKMEKELERYNWLGAGGCTELVEALALELNLKVSKSGQHRFIYDSQCHQPPPEIDPRKVFQKKWPKIFELATRINRVTDTPLLSPEQYASLFKEIAEETSKNEYQLTRTSRAVRDACIGAGTLIGRNDVIFILRLLQYSEHGFEVRNGMTRTDSIAETVAETVAARCESAQMKLETDDYAMIEGWFLGGPEKK